MDNNNMNYTDMNYNQGNGMNYNQGNGMGYNGGNGMNAGYVSSPIIQENHRMRGVLGALGGALIGGIVWTVIGCLGFISGWIAILIFVLASAGYAKLNGKQDTFGVIISLVFGLLIIVPATYCSFAFHLLQELNEGINSHFTYGEVLVDLPMYLERYGWWGNLIGSLAKGYFLTIVVAIFFVVDSLKGNSTGKKSKK